MGGAVPRKEDLRFLQGRGEYVDDVRAADALHAVPVRSPSAHARIAGISTAAALELPGVVAVVTGDDLRHSLRPSRNGLPAPFDGLATRPLAQDEVRYAGEPVAVVVARDPYGAEDAAGRVEVEYDPLPAVTDPLRAMRPDSPLVHAAIGTNLVWQDRFTYGDVAGAFARAERIVRRRLHFHRFTSAPLEPAAVVADYNPRRQDFAIVCNLQNPERFRNKIAHALDVPARSLHFHCPDVGGGFGLKSHYEWVVLLCWLARRLGRPVRWADDRTGHLSASHHGNEVWYDAELAIDLDGTIRGMRAKAVHDDGAYLEREPKGAVNQLRQASSVYRFRDLEMDFSAVLTNKSPIGPNRSYGKVPQTFLVERLIDEAARELALDPLEVRRLNLVRPEEMPYEAPTGAVHDGGDYPEALRLAAEIFDYDGFRRAQRQARAEGRYLGCGIAAGVEPAPNNAALQRLLEPTHRGVGDSEAARVRIEHDGRATVTLGTVPQGQGHETVAAQIVADELGLTPDDVDVLSGYDSWRDPSTAYSGTHASRFASMGVGALVGAARAVRAKAVEIAARHLGADPSELACEGGAVVRTGGGERLPLADLARLADLELAALGEGVQPGLYAQFVYNAPFVPPDADGRGNFSLTYAYGVTIAGVDVDPETGRVRLTRIVCVHDCGRELNPMIVEGQVHGAIAHQAGAALFERIRYDDQGQLLTATLKDYLTPTASDLPWFEVDRVETPSLVSVLGSRGGGEGAGTPLAAAVNAAADALSPFGVELRESHLAPDELRALLRARRPQAS